MRTFVMSFGFALLLAYAGLTIWAFMPERPKFQVGDCIRKEDDFLNPQVYKIIIVGKAVYVYSPGYMRGMKYQQSYFRQIHRSYYKVECR